MILGHFNSELMKQRASGSQNVTALGDSKAENSRELAALLILKTLGRDRTIAHRVKAKVFK